MILWAVFLFVIFVFLLVGYKFTEQSAKRNKRIHTLDSTEGDQEKGWEMAVQALKEHGFVMEADRIDFKRGRFAYVTASTNAASIENEKAPFRKEVHTSCARPGGGGGVTIDGIISNVEMDMDQKGHTTFKMLVQATIVPANVIFRMMQSDNNSTPISTPDFSGNQISFSGILYPESESTILKRQSV